MIITVKHLIFSLTIALLVAACTTWSTSSSIDASPTPYPKRERTTVLKGEQAEALLEQCSRPAPSKIEGTWLPSDAEIAEMESRLNEIRKLKVSYLPEIAKELKIEESHLQYAGIIVEGRKLIYINAFPIGYSDTLKNITDIDWRQHAVEVCDGGSAFWGVEYDPAKKEFFNLHVNGSA
ncbi:MAG: hypothetical protein J5I65_17970 [Aridibacter famidurans]|nr:hypothetical protein [Aridibacter famidurans]